MMCVPVRLRSPLSCLVMLLILTGCSSTYYGALEKLGIEKREILVDRIDDTRESQEEAKTQFASALEQYRSIIDVDGGELEKVYDRLNAEYQRCERDAEEVSARIEAVESVAEDLFDEWDDEIDDFADAGMARQSRKLLNETRSEYAVMLQAMQRAELSMEPVLTILKDHVPFLRHNLNARAIGSLQGELNTIEQATASLIADMEESIAEASRFMDSMR